MWRAVRRVDDLMDGIARSIRSRLGDPRVLAFSDHGMSPVRRTVALPQLLRHPGFAVRFCLALDATMVRLWYLDDDSSLRDELRGRVAKSLPGRFLGADELSALHVPFSSRLYGDEVFLVDPGTVIFPNFHSYVRPRAMHAYHPEDPDQSGIFVASTGIPADPARSVDLVDIAPLVLGLLGLTTEPDAQPPPAVLAAVGA
jgi:hypothetical protein